MSYWPVVLEILAGILQMLAARVQYDTVKTNVRNLFQCLTTVDNIVVGAAELGAACMILFAHFSATIFFTRSSRDANKLVIKIYAIAYLVISWIIFGIGIVCTALGLMVNFSNGLCSITHPGYLFTGAILWFGLSALYGMACITTLPNVQTS
ncbi:unnamed protein product [Cuscuta epithymum]|uniref:MARVEL domain-containing protein n=1 Tax=Cuscuta epithymum TaxID=186058 RepID=A0AAV0FQH3_9ASTE|nr:unnamed protein product [Cuscuta epithymum]